MNLKTVSDEFLQKVTVMRQNAITEAVQREVQMKHEPYRVQMVAKRDAELAGKEQTFQALINQLTREHDAEVATCKAEYEKAIQSHRNEVARTAEANAKGEYDKFILGVSALADEIKVN